MTVTDPMSPAPDMPPWRPRQLVRRWPWIVLAGLAGALIGLLLSQTRPPQYESSAVMAVGIDYGRTAPLELIVEDRVLSQVAALITSDRTLTLLSETLRGDMGDDPAWSDPAELRRHVRLDRKLAEWHLAAISEDPRTASQVANAWMEVSLAELDEAMDHAWEAQRLQSAHRS